MEGILLSEKSFQKMLLDLNLAPFIISARTL